MPVRIYKSNNAGRRIASVTNFSEITKSKPEKSLIMIRKRKGGRNAQGKITVRHQAGGHKQMIRIVDFAMDRFDQPAIVQSIEYDPNRTAFIALIKYSDNEKRYMISVDGLKVGDTVVSSKGKVDINKGNRLPLKNIPAGIMICNLEFFPESKAQLVKSAGSGALVMSQEGAFTQVKLPSGEIRRFSGDCKATIGQVSNTSNRIVRLGKAGRMRWLGIKPTVRGKVMNPVDHPHGGGEGKHPIGLKHPKTAQGKPALGVKTRKWNKKSNKYILRRRKNKKAS